MGPPSGKNFLMRFEHQVEISGIGAAMRDADAGQRPDQMHGAQLSEAFLVA